MKKYLFLVLLSVVGYSLAAQAKYQIESPTDSTYRIDVLQSNADGVEYTIPGVEVDSVQAINIAFQAIESNFQREGLRQRQATVHSLEARRLANEINKRFGVNYYVNNGIAEQYQGTWVYVLDGKKIVLDLKGRRLLDPTSDLDPGDQPSVRFKSRSTFEVIGLAKDADAVVPFYLDIDSDRPRFIGEVDGVRAVLIKR